MLGALHQRVTPTGWKTVSNLNTTEPDPSDIERRIAQRLKTSIADLEAIYVFGSRGTGSARSTSDYDIAVHSRKPLTPLERIELAHQLSKITGTNVDLVDLSTASTVLRSQVISTGQRLFAKSAPKQDRFEDFVYADYARLNEERAGILADIAGRGAVYGR